MVIPCTNVQHVQSVCECEQANSIASYWPDMHNTTVLVNIVDLCEREHFDKVIVCTLKLKKNAKHFYIFCTIDVM